MVWSCSTSRFSIVWLEVWRTHRGGSVPRGQHGRESGTPGDLELMWNEAVLYRGREPRIHNWGIMCFCLGEGEDEEETGAEKVPNVTSAVGSRISSELSSCKLRTTAAICGEGRPDLCKKCIWRLVCT